MNENEIGNIENLPEVCKDCEELDCFTCDYCLERFPLTEEENNRIRMLLQQQKLKREK